MAAANNPMESTFFIVTWKPPDGGNEVTDDVIESVTDAHIQAKPTITRGRRQNCAVLEFEKVFDQEYITSQCKDDYFWREAEFRAIGKTRTVVISNLPQDACLQDIDDYLSNSNFTGRLVLKNKFQLNEDEFQPKFQWCLVRCGTPKDMQDIVDHQGSFDRFNGDIRLQFTAYYDDIDPPDLMSTEDIPSVVKIDYTRAKEKLTFLKDYHDDILRQRLTENCAKIKGRSTSEGLMLSFKCKHDPKHPLHKEWDKQTEEAMKELLSKVEIVNRDVPASTRDQIMSIIKDYTGINVSVKFSEDNSSLKLTALQGDRELMQLLGDIDKIRPPTPIETTNVHLPYKRSVVAFRQLYASMIDTYSGIDEIQTDIILKGTRSKLDVDKTLVLEYAAKIVFGQYAQTPEHRKMFSRIKLDIEKQIQGQPFGYVIDGNQLYIFGKSEGDVTAMRNILNGILASGEVLIEGKLSKSDIEPVLAKIRSPTVTINVDIIDETTKVTIVCAKDQIERVKREVEQQLSRFIVTDDCLQYPFDMIKCAKYNGLLDQIKGIEVKTRTGQIVVSGTEGEKKDKQKAVKKVIEKLDIEWKSYQKGGIESFIDDNLDRKLETIDKKNAVRMRYATMEDMQFTSIRCVGVMATGQSIFVVHNDVTSVDQANFPVDVIVSCTDSQLKHLRGLAKHIAEKGGSDIRRDGQNFIKENGPLSVGSVYAGSPGRLKCQKVFHVVLPSWKGGDYQEDKELERSIDTVLSKLVEDDDLILKSVAMPLLGVGSSGFPLDIAAQIVIPALRKQMTRLSKVREVFLYDTNLDMASQLQKWMQKYFKEQCFHLPPEDISKQKEKMSKWNMTYRLQTSGERILPLPKNKTLTLKFGKMHLESADVMVCPTSTAPDPSGKIFEAFFAAAGLPAMKTDCAKEFANAKHNGKVEDGIIVQSNSGNMACNKIYFIKIAGKLQSTKALQEYVETCLAEAMRQKHKSISFPPIGVIDNNYKPDDVANTMLQTITDVMRKKMLCTIENVIIVIHDTDNTTRTEFDRVVRKLYMNRPGRLKAHDKSREKLVNDGDGDCIGDALAQVVTSRNRMVFVAPLTVAPPLHGTGKKTTAPNKPVLKTVSRQVRFAAHTSKTGDYCISAAGGTLDVEIAKLEETDGGVVVCTTSSFPSLNGAIVQALVGKGGQTIQDECKRNYQTYPNNAIPQTSPGGLKCKRIYYVKLEENKKTPACAQKLYDNVVSCLEQAEKDGECSIAFPTFGTGGFKYPNDVAADKMYAAIESFFQKPRNHLNYVRIVLFGGAAETCRVFKEKVDKMFSKTIHQPPNVGPVPTAMQPGAKPAFNVDPDPMQWTVPGTRMGVKLEYGNLEKTRADVILDTTAHFPNLGGIIPSNLMSAAGPELQHECRSLGVNPAAGEIVVTGGYKLPCARVYHYILPSWRPGQEGIDMIKKCVTECLTRMMTSGYTSIAMPTIGAGNMKYSHDLVANGIYSAVKTFGDMNQQYAGTVIVVMYKPSLDVNKVFVDTLQVFKGHVPDQHTTGQHVRVVPNINVQQKYLDVPEDVPRKRRHFLLLKTIGESSNRAEAAKEVQNHINRNHTKQKIKLDMFLKGLHSQEAFHKTETKECLRNIGDKFKVEIELEMEEKRQDETEEERRLIAVGLQGFGSAMTDCHREIMKALQDIKERALVVQSGEKAYKDVEWYYIEGAIRVPYIQHITYTLEESYSKKEKTCTFTDVDGIQYVVDFNKWTECAQDENGKIIKGTDVRVERKSFKEDSDVSRLPNTWTPMDSGTSFKLFDVDPKDAEYNDVVTAFKATLGGDGNKVQPFSLGKVTKVQRVQNPSLYRQYRIEKQYMEEKYKQSLPHLKLIERTMWHGTKADNVDAIVSTGFNRGFAGDTFQGKVWYGKGTYFAVHAAYPAGANFYTPTDNQNQKRVFLCKVLTGNTTKVDQGYQHKFAPVVPGKDSERYDSTCDDDKNPTEMVIYSDTGAYPEYLLIFTKN